jgi:hypothetical protein
MQQQQQQQQMHTALTVMRCSAWVLRLLQLMLKQRQLMTANSSSCSSSRSVKSSIKQTTRITSSSTAVGNSLVTATSRSRLQTMLIKGRGRGCTEPPPPLLLLLLLLASKRHELPIHVPGLQA